MITPTPSARPSHRTAPGGGNRVILIVKQGIQRTHGQRSQFLKFVKRLDGPQIERRQGTQRDFTVLIAKIRQRFRRQRDLQTQIGLVNRSDRRIERTVRIAVIDILDINPACRCPLLHHEGKQLDSFHPFFADRAVGFVLPVQALERILIGKESLVKPGDIRRTEQCDVSSFYQALIHQAVQLDTVIQMAYTVFFNAPVVFQHQQAFRLEMPQRIVNCRRSTPDTSLRTGFDRTLEKLVKRNASGMKRLPSPDRTAQRPDTAGTDSDSGPLGHIFHNGAGCRIDRIETVAAIDQYTGS